MPITDFRIKLAFLNDDFRNPIKQFLFDIEMSKAASTPMMGASLDKVPHETYNIVNIINAIDKLSGTKKELFFDYRKVLSDELIQRYSQACEFLEKNKKAKDAILYNSLLKHDLNRNRIIQVIAFDDIPQKYKNQYTRDRIEELREQLKNVSKKDDFLNYISIDFDFNLAARCMYANGYSSKEVNHFSKEIELAALKCDNEERGIVDMVWSVITPSWRGINKFSSKEVLQERYTPFVVINEKQSREFLLPILPWIRGNLNNKKYDRLKNRLAEQVECLMKEECTTDDFTRFLIEFYKDVRHAHSEKEYLHVGASFFGGVSKRTEFAAVDKLLELMSCGGELDVNTKSVLKQGKLGGLLNSLSINLDHHFESKILPEVEKTR